MPRQSQNSKSTSDAKKKKSVKSVKKEIKKKPVKKEEKESLKPERKAKPVIVDIIKDDENDSFDYSGRSGAFEYPDFKEEVEEVSEQVESYAKETFAGDIDSQKKFFEELSSEIEERKKELEEVNEITEHLNEDALLDLFEDEKKDQKKAHPMKIALYRRFVWRFVFVVAFLALLVSYFSFSKLTIDVIPVSEGINDSLQLKISSASTTVQTIEGLQIIKGVIKKVTVEAESEFSSSGEEYAGESISGRVKVINNYGKSQSLVASTRLLSPDNKIFRIKETITVPAGGEVWVDIYVEKPDRDFAIKATSFTIPGLWVGLQDKIYAKSEEAFVFEEKKEMYVRPSDIAAAEKGIKDKIAEKLEVMIDEELLALKDYGSEMTAVYLAGNEIKTEIGAKADDKVSKFTAKASGQATIVFFPKNEVENLALSKIQSRISDGKELAEFNSGDINYSLIEVLSENDAVVQASFSGKMMLKNDEDVIDRESLINLSSEQISAYLRQQKGIKSFRLNFSPSFIKKAPRLVDRIEIDLVNE